MGVFQMAEITAGVVMKLRQISGQGMMDCKQALGEAGGDMEKAMDILRKKGLATLSKRAERETTEGLVVTITSDDGKNAILASLCCETDFVAKSDDFIAAAEKLVDYAMACSADSGVQAIIETKLNGKSFEDIVTECVSKTGEKMQVGDYAKFKLDGPGFIKVYVHFNKKVGTMIQVQTSDDKVAASPSLRTTVGDIAMHITAVKPLALDTSGIPQEKIDREKAIYADQVKNKPLNIVDKIVEGKVKKFFADNCLLQQPFVKDDSKTVSEVLAQAAKEAGGKASIERFVRFEVG
ncbi:MAG: translation elongation factor Ts [Candidatus Brocadiia bacterium]|nr:MAG: translation elongation factor Ts [Candidatus Brocadiia bacterium]